MATATQQEFDRLQRLAQLASKAQHEYDVALAVKYGSGNRHYAKATERKRYDQLVKAAGKAQDRLYQWLQLHSSRDWSQGIGCSWVVHKLTFAVAVNSGEIEYDPKMAAWGYTEADTRVFCQPNSCQPNRS